MTAMRANSNSEGNTIDAEDLTQVYSLVEPLLFKQFSESVQLTPFEQAFFSGNSERLHVDPHVAFFEPWQSELLKQL